MIQKARTEGLSLIRNEVLLRRKVSDSNIKRKATDTESQVFNFQAGDLVVYSCENVPSKKRRRLDGEPTREFFGVYKIVKILEGGHTCLLGKLQGTGKVFQANTKHLWPVRENQAMALERLSREPKRGIPLYRSRP